MRLYLLAKIFCQFRQEPNYVGTHGRGTVFKFTPGGTLTALYSFCSKPSCSDGATPAARLLQATDGNFYGTTSAGGADRAGTVFKITPSGTLTTLYSFCSQGFDSQNCSDGYGPSGALIQATDGNFYGTTAGGQYTGTNGTIFNITPGGALTTLYSFSEGSDGVQPLAGLIQASDGNFYGTNQHTIFKITPDGTLTTLYVFPFSDTQTLLAGLIQATDGNFYGAISGSGTNGVGTLFKITLDGVLTTLNNFCCSEGPDAGLIEANDGNLYGTTGWNVYVVSGPANGGTVFKLAIGSATAAPVISEGGVVNGASFLPGIVASGSLITIYGTNLAPRTDTWGKSVVNGNLPTSLDGVSVSVGGEPAYIAYISPTQINALAPSLVETETITVTNSGETSAAISVDIGLLDPAFFQWPGNYAVATHQDYSPAVKDGALAGEVTTPAKPGEIITLWGTGFGPTSPSAPIGVEIPSGTTYNTANAVMVTVGGTAATVYGAVLAPGFAGLYQVNIQIPTSLANGDYAVVATVLSAQSPSTTLITVQN